MAVAALILGGGAAHAENSPAPSVQPEQSASLAVRGQQLYAHHCSHCHGFNMVNPGTAAFDLRTFPHNDKSRFFNSVTQGKNNRMPPWGDLLSKDEIECLWAYVSSYKEQ